MLNPVQAIKKFLSPPPPREEEFFLISSNSALPHGATVLKSETVNGIPVQIGRFEGKALYYVQEPSIGEREHDAYIMLMKNLTAELELPEGPFDSAKLSAFVEENARRIAKQYAFTPLYEAAEDKLLYYIKRDILGYGPIDVLLRDPRIEDVKAEAPATPFGVWCRQYAKYDWLETNITLDSDQMAALASKLVYMGKKTVSTAMPIVDIILPDKHRVTTTYGTEVSPKGTTLALRKFREHPLTIIHEIDFGTISPLMASYFWSIIDNKGSLLLVGETASGKTSLINALAILIRPSRSVVTVEDIPELNLSHGRWQSLTARHAYTLGTRAGEIDLFKLVATSLRLRPDFLIVGEIIGEESYTLFQSIATGHGGVSSFHAENADFAIKRLLQPPISIAPMYITMLNAIVTLRTVRLPNGNVARRVVNVDELAGVEDGTVRLKRLFMWNPNDNTFSPSSSAELASKSMFVESLSRRRETSIQAIAQELEEQVNFLQLMRSRDIKEFEDMAKALREYYAAKTPDEEEASPPITATSDLLEIFGKPAPNQEEDKHE
jgi:flagellar protein FlaI